MRGCLAAGPAGNFCYLDGDEAPKNDPRSPQPRLCRAGVLQLPALGPAGERCGAAEGGAAPVWVSDPALRRPDPCRGRGSPCRGPGGFLQSRHGCGPEPPQYHRGGGGGNRYSRGGGGGGLRPADLGRPVPGRRGAASREQLSQFF